MKKIFVALSMVAFLVACDDSASASSGPNDEPGMESSSSVELGSSSSEKVKSQSSSSEKSGKSSSSVIDVLSSSEKFSVTSSSSAGKIESSSSKSDVPQSYAEAKVMPSGTYDCTKYKCVTTEYLNQEFLEAGKYGEILDERDGQVYKTVQIGDQVWMAQNLNLETENSLCGGGFITREEGNCSVYGRQYTLVTAMGKTGAECGYEGLNCDLDSGNVQGICPSGWHLPDTTEWNALFAAVGGSSTAGQTLKAQTRWKGFSSFTYEDAYGFSALPAGERNTSGTFGIVDAYAFFRSASELSIRLAYNNLDVSLWGHEVYGHSVRCLKD